ncbi:hypothetical protein T439DRAFT_334507 [Meredithblackwellia eburnea MCA 4105]
MLSFKYKWEKSLLASVKGIPIFQGRERQFLSHMLDKNFESLILNPTPLVLKFTLDQKRAAEVEAQRLHSHLCEIRHEGYDLEYGCTVFQGPDHVAVHFNDCEKEWKDHGTGMFNTVGEYRTCWQQANQVQSQRTRTPEQEAATKDADYLAGVEQAKRDRVRSGRQPKDYTSAYISGYQSIAGKAEWENRVRWENNWAEQEKKLKNYQDEVANLGKEQAWKWYSSRRFPEERERKNFKVLAYKNAFIAEINHLAPGCGEKEWARMRGATNKAWGRQKKSKPEQNQDREDELGATSFLNCSGRLKRTCFATSALRLTINYTSAPIADSDLSISRTAEQA